MVACLFSFIFHYIILPARAEGLAVGTDRDARLEGVCLGGMLRCMMGQASPIHGTLG